MTRATDARWHTAYAAAFFRKARARGWTDENAAAWVDHLAPEAILAAREHGRTPAAQAALDVLAAEKEAETLY